MNSAQPMLIITPVKDSLTTAKKTIKSIAEAKGNVQHYIFNDFSSGETAIWLKNNAPVYGYNYINLAEHIKTPSPNYLTVLQMAQKMALEKKSHLVIIESDVIVKTDTVQNLWILANKLKNVGLIGAVTTDNSGKINYPYLHVKEKDPELFISPRSVTFCCSILSYDLLKAYDFKNLNSDKDWFDVGISQMSRKLGFVNYVSKANAVIHMPHSSRPWKNEKYSNPLKYYFKKIFFGKDKI